MERLERSDATTRERRARWALEIDEVIESFPLITMTFVAGGQESGVFLGEAVGCYLHGHFAASLVCAHATCERELAGRVAHNPTTAPKGWERWGLGRLIQHARERGWHSDATIEFLEAVNERRRSVYHFRDFSADGGLFRRTYAARPWQGKEAINVDMSDQLRMDALEAIRAALAVRAE
jgi:hypothetical protein